MLVQPTGTVAAAGDAVEAAGGEVQLTGGGLVQALVPPDAMPALRASGAVEGIDPAPVATADDAVTSFGSARVGAPALHAAGLRGAGVKIAVLDQAFGLVSRLDDLAGTELPALPLQHRRSFDATYGLAGRDYNGNTSRHGEFVAEVVHDVAPDAELWFVNYRTHLEFDQAVTYLIDEVHPDIVVHSNSFLFGPFDGSGWFARRVDRAAAAGIMWVDSVGNYRERHFEGAVHGRRRRRRPGRRRPWRGVPGRPDRDVAAVVRPDVDRGGGQRARLHDGAASRTPTGRTRWWTRAAGCRSSRRRWPTPSRTRRSTLRTSPAPARTTCASCATEARPARS